MCLKSGSFKKLQNMPLACYLCYNGKATHRFPKEPERLTIWKQYLGLHINPPENARICSEHFVSSDFYERAGRKYVKTEAVPSRFVKSYVAGHNYAVGMVYEEESYPPEIFIIAVFGLLLLFDFFLSFSFSQPSTVYPQGNL